MCWSQSDLAETVDANTRAFTVVVVVREIAPVYKVEVELTSVPSSEYRICPPGRSWQDQRLCTWIKSGSFWEDRNRSISAEAIPCCCWCAGCWCCSCTPCSTSIRFRPMELSGSITPEFYCRLKVPDVLTRNTFHLLCSTWTSHAKILLRCRMKPGRNRTKILETLLSTRKLNQNLPLKSVLVEKKIIVHFYGKHIRSVFQQGFEKILRDKMNPRRHRNTSLLHGKPSQIIPCRRIPAYTCVDSGDFYSIQIRNKSIIVIRIQYCFKILESITNAECLSGVNWDTRGYCSSVIAVTKTNSSCSWTPCSIVKWNVSPVGIRRSWSVHSVFPGIIFIYSCFPNAYSLKFYPCRKRTQEDTPLKEYWLKETKTGNNW